VGSGCPRLFFAPKRFFDLLPTGASSFYGALDLAFALAGLFRFVLHLVILSRSHSFPILASTALRLCHRRRCDRVRRGCMDTTLKGRGPNHETYMKPSARQAHLVVATW
jgi:hypothetical protein